MQSADHLRILDQAGLSKLFAQTSMAADACTAHLVVVEERVAFNPFDAGNANLVAQPIVEATPRGDVCRLVLVAPELDYPS